MQEMKFGWKVVVGSIVGFLGAALGSVGGVGGGGIFVPMLTLIIGFDPKSSTAISKCMQLNMHPHPRFMLNMSATLTVFELISRYDNGGSWINSVLQHET